MQSEAINPIQQNKRIEIIDILRGWALLGVVLMNYVDYFYLGLDEKFKMDQFAGYLQQFSNLVFAGKSWTMLSFLFGYGFAVLMENTHSKGMNPIGFFSRRMFWLYILAIINSSFFFGDILKDYAIMGMIMLLLNRASAKTSFIISIALFLLIPFSTAYIAYLKAPGGFELMKPYFHFYTSPNILHALWFGLAGSFQFAIMSLSYLVTIHVIMLACVLLGQAAQKASYFSRIKEKTKTLIWIAVSCLVFYFLLGGIFGVVNKFKFTSVFTYYQPYHYFTLASMIFVVAIVCLLYNYGLLKSFFSAMQTIGKMTLTNYIVQNFLGIFIFSGFGFGLSLVHKIHFGYYMLIALVIYVVQVYFSKWWLSKYYYGPIEWIWRQLSYGKKLKLKRDDI